MPDPVVELERLAIPELALGIAREPGSERLTAHLITPERPGIHALPLLSIIRAHEGELLAKANRLLDASSQEPVDQAPSRRSAAVASMQTQFQIDQYLHYLGWAKTHPGGELAVDGVDCRWGRAQTNALIEELEERLKQLGVHGNRPIRDSGRVALHSHADLAQSLVARIPAAAIMRMAAGVCAEDVAFALADSGRREGFVPAKPVSVVSSSDGSRVFAVQGEFADPASVRASIAIDQVRPGTATALRESLSHPDTALTDATP